ncbi:MAG: HEAT repeat domain-containing protein [Gammaproteobacteria bacterium]|nr:HEAT repeat domain-containing protein [Gammaproteobacteria bacterium]
MSYRFMSIYLTVLVLTACGGPAAKIADRPHAKAQIEGTQQRDSNWGQAATNSAIQYVDQFQDRQHAQDEALENLRFALADADSEVRVEAVAQLTEFTGEYIADLLSYAYIDPHTSVRMEVVDAIGDIGGDRALSLLSIALTDDRNEVREAAVEACSSIGGDAAAMVLSTALADEDAEIREEVLYALHEIGGSVAQGLLQQALSDEDEELRKLAGTLLQRTPTADLQ